MPEAELSDVEFYIARFDNAKQERLVKIRNAVKERFPDSSERVYYGIPTAERNGKTILYYAAYKNHVSIITGYELTAYLQEKYPQYRYTRASVIFPDELPFPEDYVKAICGMLG